MSDEIKWAQTVIFTETFPRYGTVVQLVTDNGLRKVNQIMKTTLACLNIMYLTTSTYPPQGNAKVERFHKTLADILAGSNRENS